MVVVKFSAGGGGWTVWHKRTRLAWSSQDRMVCAPILYILFEAILALLCLSRDACSSRPHYVPRLSISVRV